MNDNNHWSDYNYLNNRLADVILDNKELNDNIKGLSVNLNNRLNTIDTNTYKELTKLNNRISFLWIFLTLSLILNIIVLFILYGGGI